MRVGCILCYELFTDESDDMYTIRCGHIFHHACLLQWLERSRSCPQCRARAYERSMIKLHRSHVGGEDVDVFALRNQVQNLTREVDTMEKDIGQLREEMAVLEKKLTEAWQVAEMTEKKLTVKCNSVAVLEAKAKRKALTAKKVVEAIGGLLFKLINVISEQTQDPNVLSLYSSILKRELKKQRQSLHDCCHQTRVKNLFVDFLAECGMVELEHQETSDWLQSKCTFQYFVDGIIEHLKTSKLSIEENAMTMSSPGIQREKHHIVEPEREDIVIDDSPVVFQNLNLKRKRTSETAGVSLDATPSSSSSTAHPVPSTSAVGPTQIKKRLNINDFNLKK